MSNTSIIEELIVDEFAKLVKCVEYTGYESEINKALLDLAKKHSNVDGINNLYRVINN